MIAETWSERCKVAVPFEDGTQGKSATTRGLFAAQPLEISERQMDSPLEPPKRNPASLYVDSSPVKLMLKF